MFYTCSFCASRQPSSMLCSPHNVFFRVCVSAHGFFFGPVFSFFRAESNIYGFSPRRVTFVFSVARAHNGMTRPSGSPLTDECMWILNWTTLAFRLCSFAFRFRRMTFLIEFQAPSSKRIPPSLLYSIHPSIHPTLPIRGYCFYLKATYLCVWVKNRTHTPSYVLPHSDDFDRSLSVSISLTST